MTSNERDARFIRVNSVSCGQIVGPLYDSFSVVRLLTYCCLWAEKILKVKVKLGNTDQPVVNSDEVLVAGVDPLLGVSAVRVRTDGARYLYTNQI